MKRFFGGLLCRRSLTLCVSPLRAPILSFAHYFQAPATQASKDSGFEIVHPSHSKMEKEEDITEEEYRVPSEEKTATKQHDLKNEEKEDKMSE